MARQVDAASLFTSRSLDPLSLTLAFCLSDLPVALGEEPYFPKELIRIVHEYATELSFVVELEESDGCVLQRQIGSCVDFLRWLGRYSPRSTEPYCVRERGLRDIDESTFDDHANSCLKDEEMRQEYGADISMLLCAQLKPNE